MEQAGEYAAQPNGNFLHSQRCANTPLSAHNDAEDGANKNELTECVSETGEDFNDGEREQIDGERKSPAIAVGDEPEDEGPDRTKSQSCCERQRHRLVVFGETMADGCKAEDDKEEIEPVESPARERAQERAEPRIPCLCCASKRCGGGDHLSSRKEQC